MRPSVAALVGEDEAIAANDLVLPLICTPGSTELLKAFSEIPSAKQRRRLIELAEVLAAGD